MLVKVDCKDICHFTQLEQSEQKRKIIENWSCEEVKTWFEKNKKLKKFPEKFFEQEITTMRNQLGLSNWTSATPPAETKSRKPQQKAPNHHIPGILTYDYNMNVKPHLILKHQPWQGRDTPCHMRSRKKTERSLRIEFSSL